MSQARVLPIAFALLVSVSTAHAEVCPIGQFTYQADIVKVYDGDTVTR